MVDETPEDDSNTLVMAGGGIKGLANAPAFRVLQETGQLDKIEVCIGSSVGGLNSGALALGGTVDELETLLATGGKGLLDLASSSPVFNASLKNVKSSLANALGKQGVAKGFKLYEICQSMVSEKLGSPHATFADLSAKIGQTSNTGGKFRSLQVTITISDERGNYQIVCSPETTPNMPLALALRGTAGLPPVFPPLKFSPEDLRKWTKGATEPLVKYDRGEPFPSFHSQAFYKLPQQQRQAKIDEINEDIFTNAKRSDGKIYGSDGGVVDNVPAYLAVNREGGDIKRTLAFNFEAPWQQKKRLENAYYYAKDAEITPQTELDYIYKALNLPKNDRVYYLFQKYITDSRVPPSHQLALMQNDALLNFDSDDITAADFDLASDKHMSHEEKEAYLLTAGYVAVGAFLESRGLKPPRSFREMYPKAAVPPPSIETQLEQAEEELAIWEKLFNELGEHAQREVFFTSEVRRLRGFLKKARQAKQTHDIQSQVIAFQLRNIKEFTEENLSEIVEAKKKCQDALDEAVNNLSKFEKLNYMLKSRFEIFNKALFWFNPQLAHRLDVIKHMSQSNKLLYEMTGLLRDDSLEMKPGAGSTIIRMASVLAGTVRRGVGSIFPGQAATEATTTQPTQSVSGPTSRRDKSVESAAVPALFSPSFERNKDEQPSTAANALPRQKNITYQSVYTSQRLQFQDIVELADTQAKDPSSNVMSVNKSKSGSSAKIQLALGDGNETGILVRKFGQKVEFSVEKFTDETQSEQKLKKVYEKACELAVNSANRTTEFTIPESFSEKKQKMLQEAFQQALKQAMQKEPPLFTEDALPKVKIGHDPVKLRL